MVCDSDWQPMRCNDMMPWFTFGNGVWLPKFEFCRPLWKWKFSLFVTDFTVMQIFEFWLHFRIRGCFCVEPSQKRTSKFVFCSCKIYKALALSKPPQLSQSMMVPNFVTKGPALALLWELAHLDDFNKWAYSLHCGLRLIQVYPDPNYLDSDLKLSTWRCGVSMEPSWWARSHWCHNSPIFDEYQTQSA